MSTGLAAELGDPLQADTLQVQDDLDDILADIVDRRELVPDTLDLDARDRNSLQERSRIRRSALPSVVPYPGSSGSILYRP